MRPIRALRASCRTPSRPGGAALYNRLTKVTYPDGREVFYNYPSSGIGAVLSRLDNIADDASGTTKYAQYTYLGAPTIVQVAHPAVNGNLVLSYGTGGTYAGWDLLGRVIEQTWKVNGLPDAVHELHPLPWSAPAGPALGHAHQAGLPGGPAPCAPTAAAS